VPAAKRVGSGYLLTERLVLTSYHVVQGTAPGTPVEVRPLDDHQSIPWLTASVCWPIEPVDINAAPGDDAALLLVDAPSWNSSPLPGRVRFGRVAGQDRVPCFGLGFPDAEARPDKVRDTMPVRGNADPLQARKSSLLTVHVDEGIVPRARGWAGASGTALFCGPLLIGVLATDRNIADDASVLAAVPVSTLAALPGFGETLAQHGLDVRIEHEPVLNAYLTASQAASREHPYAGVLPGITPPLATVYLEKQQAPPPDPEQPGGSDAGLLEARQLPLPADDVLAEEQTCMLLAGPGGGKTSLLRTRLARGVARWLEGHCEGALPVLVTAAALDGCSLAQALAKAVSADLAPHGLVDDLPPIFFRTPPQPGARWLVLVDSLDEITDPAARRRVLSNLAAVSAGEHADLYRFVVASRPLPAGELDALGSHLAHYNLEPLRTSDLPGVVSGWFRAFGMPDPDRAARQFTEALARAKLTDLARIPLLASMLCRLQVAAPGEPLPASRGKIFKDFIALLRERQYTSDSAVRERQTRYAVLKRYPGATAQAERTLSSLHVLIAHLAAERYRGDTRPAITILESRPEAKRPQDVPQDKWRDFLGASLRASGLLTVRGHEYEFLHQTFLEYFAACDATRDERARHEALLGMLPQGRWARYHHFGEVPAGIDSSYYGFVIETWQEGQGDQRPLIKVLKRWASPGNEAGREFLAQQVILGTALPDSVTHAVEENLEWLARFRIPRYANNSAAATLARLDHDRGARLACDPACVGPPRRHAARELAKLGDKRGPDLLATLASDARLDSITRLMACGELADFDRPRATEILATLARDSSLDIYDRYRAAKELGSLGDERSTPLLAEIDVPLRHRIGREAAWTLAHFQWELPREDYRLGLGRTLCLTYLASPRSRRLEHRMIEIARNWGNR
jgi:hypothetical protein